MDWRRREDSRGFDLEGKAACVQSFNERSEELRFERFPSSDDRTPARECPGLPNQRLERHLMPTSRIPGVLGVAPAASHGAPLKPNEDRRHAGSDTLPLD